MDGSIPAPGLSPLALSATTVAQFATANAQYGATATGTVGNTLTETTIIGSGTGSLTLASNKLTAGKSMLVYAWGNLGSTLTPTLQVRVKIGGATILDTTASTLATITGTNMWQMSCYITTRTAGAGGTAIAQGFFSYFSAANVQQNIQLVRTTTFSVDTTAALVIDATAQWGTADPLNTLSATNFSVLLLG